MRHRQTLNLMPFRSRSLAAVVASAALGVATMGAPAAASEKNIVETAQAAGGFETLIAAVEAANLAPLLTGDRPLTVFAPTDDAFAALPDGTVEALLESANRDVLIAILAYHVVEGGVLSMEAKTLDSAETLNTQSIAIARKGNALTINNANVIKADILASNGVIHVIDAVLIPDGALERIVTTTEPMTLQNVIELAVERGAPLFNDGQQDACAAIYEVTIASLLASSRDTFSNEVAEAMQQALRSARQEHSASSKAWTLRRALDRAYVDLENRSQEMAGKQANASNMTSWDDAIAALNGTARDNVEYVREAELPAGFPEPSPVGEIRIKSYPQYRAAVADQSGNQGSTFMRLFFHIKSNDIAMTAPVEQTIDANGGMKSMAFLYGDPDMGSTGTTGAGVKVIDTPSQTVVSIGVRGRENSQRIEEEVNRLREFVNAYSDRLEITGDPRVMGYNSPMVRDDKRYWEVQIPVRLKNTGAEARADVASARENG